MYATHRKVSQVSDVSKENAAERKTFSSFRVASDLIKSVLEKRKIAFLLDFNRQSLLEVAADRKVWKTQSFLCCEFR